MPTRTISKPARRVRKAPARTPSKPAPTQAKRRPKAPPRAPVVAKPSRSKRPQRAIDWLAELTRRAPSLAPFGDHDRAAVTALAERRDAWISDADDGRARLRFFVAAECLGVRALWVSASPARVRREAARLAARGIAATVFETAADASRKAALERVARGSSGLVLASVNALSSPELERALGRAGIELIALEDPHLASELAHELRPAFSGIGPRLRRLGKVTLHALGRPLPDSVARDAASELGLATPAWLTEGTFPPKLAVETQSVRGEGKHAALAHWIERLGGPGVVLCATPHEVDAAAAALASTGARLHRAHAGMPAPERRAELERFASLLEPGILLTTSAEAPSSGLPGLCEPTEDAFAGYGHDGVRRDLRFLVHFHAPASLEQYAREIAWLGRDGGTATAVLFYDTAHRSLNQAILGQQRLQAGHATEIGRALGALLATARPSSIETLAFGSGQSRRATERLVALLVDAGVAERIDGKVRPLGDAEALRTGVDRLTARLGQLSLRDPRALEAVERFALGRECKLGTLRASFGLDAGTRCGACTACNAAASVPEQPARRAQRR